MEQSNILDNGHKEESFRITPHLFGAIVHIVLNVMLPVLPCNIFKVTFQNCYFCQLVLFNISCFASTFGL